MAGAGKDLACGVTWAPQNTMHFVGVVDAIIPPKQIISNGRVHLIRMVIVKEVTQAGKMVSEVALQLPDKFFVSMIEPLMTFKVPTEFTFYCKAVRKADSCITVCNCIAIRPLNRMYRKYNQVLQPRKKNQRKPLPPRVDSQGFKYPYNY